MKQLVWFMCFTLSFGFIELSHSNEGQPPYVPPIEFGRKRDADTQLNMVNRADRILKVFKTVLEQYNSILFHNTLSRTHGSIEV